MNSMTIPGPLASPSATRVMILARRLDELFALERCVRGMALRVIALACRRSEMMAAITRVAPDILIIEEELLPSMAGRRASRMRERWPGMGLVVLKSGAASNASVNAATVCRWMADACEEIGIPHPFSIVDQSAHDLFEELLEQIVMDWQPLYRGKDGSIYGFEALVRSDHGQVRTAAQILGLAESLDRREELERQILRACARDAHSRALPGKLMINISVAMFMSGLLGSSEDPLLPLARRVVLEVNEHGAIGSVDRVAAQGRRLRVAGYELALDDLGSGQDYLARLLALEPSVFKLDRLALAGCDHDPRKRRYVQAIVAMAHEEQGLVVAEGVERPVEAELAVALGCDLLQGYLLARPARRLHWESHSPALTNLPFGLSAKLAELPTTRRQVA